MRFNHVKDDHGLSHYILIFVVGFIVYSNTLHSPFQFDDIAYIDGNLQKGVVRILGSLSFYLNYYFYGHDVISYHIFNIFIHLMTGILFYIIIVNTCEIISIHSAKDSFMGGQSHKIALFSTLIWLVHPIQIQSVTYISQRMNSLAAMFYLLTFFFYLKGRSRNEKKEKTIFFVAAALSFFCSIMSKENTAMLPVIIFLYEWLICNNGKYVWFKKRYVKLMVIFGFMLTLTGLFMSSLLYQFALSTYAFTNFEFTLSERLLSCPRILLLYISLIFFPHPSRLNLDWEFSVSPHIFEPITTFPSIIVVISLIVIGFYFIGKDPVLSFAIFWFFINLIIESTVIGLELIYQYRLYVPSMFSCFVFVYLIYKFVLSNKIRFSILIIIVLTCSVLTYQRNIIWGDTVTLWTDCVKKSGNKARPHSNLACYLQETGRSEEALFHFEKAVQLDPDFSEALNGIAYILATHPDPQKRDSSRALRLIKKAIELGGRDVAFLDTYGAALAEDGQTGKAGTIYEEARYLAERSGNEKMSKHLEEKIGELKEATSQ